MRVFTQNRQGGGTSAVTVGDRDIEWAWRPYLSTHVPFPSVYWLEDGCERHHNASGRMAIMHMNAPTRLAVPTSA